MILMKSGWTLQLMYYSLIASLIYVCRVIEGRVKGKREFGDHIDSDEEEETAPEKRLRLAKEYLSRLEEEGIIFVLIQCKM